MRQIVGCVVLIFVSSLGLAGSDLAVVDCDAGGDLAAALEQAAAGGPTRIRILGTCVGEFEVTAPFIQLFGDEDGESAIEAPEFGIALRFVSPGSGSVRDLTIGGGLIGVYVAGPQTGVGVNDCELADNDLGILVTNGSRAFVNRTVIRDGELGMQIEDHSSASVGDSQILRNSNVAVVVFDYSTLFVSTSEIRENLFIGISAQRHSIVEVDNSTFADNGEVHAFASGHTRLQLRSSTTLGSPSDPTLFSVAVEALSELQINDEVVAHGDLLATNASYVRLATSQILGTARMQEFSNIRVFRSSLDGIECRSGADAHCGSGASTSTSGCPGAQDVCLATSGERMETPSPVEAMLDRLRGVGQTQGAQGEDAERPAPVEALPRVPSPAGLVPATR